MNVLKLFSALLLATWLQAAAISAAHAEGAKRGAPQTETREQFDADAERIASRVMKLLIEIETFQRGSAKCDQVVATFSELKKEITDLRARVRETLTMSAEEKLITDLVLRLTDTMMQVVEVGLKERKCIEA